MTIDTLLVLLRMTTKNVRACSKEKQRRASVYFSIWKRATDGKMMMSAGIAIVVLDSATPYKQWTADEEYFGNVLVCISRYSTSCR